MPRAHGFGQRERLDRQRHRNRRLLGALAGVAGLAALGCAAVAGVSAPAGAATQGPCDIYAAGGTPCVAAHSTTRALYGSYNGALYQVQRASDQGTADVRPTAAGGVANSATQDSFCANTSCVITKVYDQSGNANTLTRAPAGGFSGPAAGGADNPAPAAAAPVYLNGAKAYGVFVAPGTGYRVNATRNIPTGDNPEGMYAVLDATHFNGNCCFDYGNAETDNYDDGNGTMETIYFGNSTFWSRGAGNGPWVMADLENGLFSGADPKYNGSNPSITGRRFQTAVVKGGANKWAIRGASSQSGALSTYWNGARPTVGGYNPMKKQGAIILGIGGDNSNGAAGTFYEGVMTKGYPLDATENSVQANVVAAKYTAPSRTTFTPGSTISLRATTPGYTNNYVQHDQGDDGVGIAPATTSATRAAANWTVRAGLADSSCVSFESRDRPGSYLRHYDFAGHLQANDGSAQFAADATFCPQPGNAGTDSSFRSYNYTSNYLRHYATKLYNASNNGGNGYESKNSFGPDSTFAVGGAL